MSDRMERVSPRARRLMDLYQLRAKILAEIAGIEAAIYVERQEAELLVMSAQANTERRRRAVAECGTDGGYHHHRRQLKEPPCQACRMAHTAYEKDRRARQTAAAS